MKRPQPHHDRSRTNPSTTEQPRSPSKARFFASNPTLWTLALLSALATSSFAVDGDGDGLDDSVETNTGVFVNASNTGTNPNKSDTDGDCVPDGMELFFDKDPTVTEKFAVTKPEFEEWISTKPYPINWLSYDNYLSNSIWAQSHNLTINQGINAYDSDVTSLFDGAGIGSIIASPYVIDFSLDRETSIKGFYIRSDGDRSTSSIKLESKKASGEWTQVCDLLFPTRVPLPGVVIYKISIPLLYSKHFRFTFGSSNSRLIGHEPRITELIIVPGSITPKPPELILDSFYESSASQSLTVNATPTAGYPINFTYQWYFDGLPIPALFGGKSATQTMDGTRNSEGTWRVVVTNSEGSAERSFVYRVFTDADSDGLSNYRESNLTGTNPIKADSDDDGLNDFVEVNTQQTNPNSKDSDSDGFEDGFELANNSNARLADSKPPLGLDVELTEFYGIPTVDFHVKPPLGGAILLEESFDMKQWNAVDFFWGGGVPFTTIGPRSTRPNAFYRLNLIDQAK